MLTKSQRAGYKAAVRAGSAFLSFLDTNIRNENLKVSFGLPSDLPWFIRTDIDELDLSDGFSCSLAQYAKKNYFVVYNALGFTVDQQQGFGFVLPSIAYDDEVNESEVHWAYLTKCWRKEIKRLRADNCPHS